MPRRPRQSQAHDRNGRGGAGSSETSPTAMGRPGWSIGCLDGADVLISPTTRSARTAAARECGAIDSQRALISRLEVGRQLSARADLDTGDRVPPSSVDDLSRTRQRQLAAVLGVIDASRPGQVAAPVPSSRTGSRRQDMSRVVGCRRGEEGPKPLLSHQVTEWKASAQRATLLVRCREEVLRRFEGAGLNRVLDQRDHLSGGEVGGHIRIGCVEQGCDGVACECVHSAALGLQRLQQCRVIDRPASRPAASHRPRTRPRRSHRAANPTQESKCCRCFQKPGVHPSPPGGGFTVTLSVAVAVMSLGNPSGL